MKRVLIVSGLVIVGVMVFAAGRVTAQASHNPGCSCSDHSQAVPMQSSGRECDVCGGTGRSRLCGQCNGSGKVNDYSCTGCYGSGRMKCIVCKGTGKVR